ncbi:MAG: virulence RhuM family protein, partial [Coriobacteriales bacterium]|nr:virulence RhuM family protein [Coriobacteriales bacterium]
MTQPENEIVIFSVKDVDICLVIDPEQETVWATHQQIAELFGIDRTGATRHINNIFKSGEVEEESNVQKMHIAKSDRPVKYYNLDVILSVGYRANSAKAIEFRRWANTVLKKYIVKGAAVNERRLEQIGTVVNILSRSSEDLVS